MRMKWIVAVVLTAAGCTSTTPKEPTASHELRRIDPAAVDPEVDAVAMRLAGTFDNAGQSAAAPRDFSPVSFDTCVITLEGSTLAPSARVLFVERRERTAGGSIKRPRFLAIERTEDDRLRGRYYRYPGERDYTGLCRKPAGERIARAADLASAECDVYFTREADGRDIVFAGSTEGQGCPSSFMGASRLVVEVALRADGFTIWERWYDARGKLVEGARTGPYVLTRVPENELDMKEPPRAPGRKPRCPERRRC